MSHFTSISTEIRDLEVCKKALNNMGLSLIERGNCRYYYGTEIKDNVVKLPGKYDMALENKNDETYSISADFYKGEVERTIGKRGSILLKNYGVEMLKKNAKKMRFSINTIDSNKFKVRDPQDPNGGYMIVTFDEQGNVEFTPKGIRGRNCSKFLALEDTIGKAKKREFLKEYYATERETIKVDKKERIQIGKY